MAKEEIDTGAHEVLCHVENAVAVVTLNRPEARNALSTGLKTGLKTVLATLADDKRVGCLVLTGAGGAFCAGGDVKGMSDRAKKALGPLDERTKALEQDQSAISAALHQFPRPTIASLPGPAAGAGFALALACDMRIAAERAFITTAYVKVGLSGDYGMSWYLPRLVGPAKAAELFFTAARVSAEECERLGIVNRVVPDDALEQATLALAEQIANGPRVALNYMKENLQPVENESLSQAMRREADKMMRCMDTDDHREAATAFVEKRTPRFQGR